MNTNTLSHNLPDPMTARLQSDGCFVLEVEHQSEREDEQLSLVDALRLQDSILRLMHAQPKD